MKNKNIFLTHLPSFRGPYQGNPESHTMACDNSVVAGVLDSGYFFRVLKKFRNDDLGWVKTILVTVSILLLLSPKAKADTLSIIVASHIYPILFEARPADVHRIVMEMKAYKPDLLVMPGDIIPGTWDIDNWTEKEFADTAALRKNVESQWARVDSIFKPLGVPILVAPGNHDISSYNLAYRDIVKDVFLKKVGPDFQHFSVKGCNFILLNSVEARRTHTLYSIKEAHVDSLKVVMGRDTWGRDALRTTWQGVPTDDVPPTLIFLHHPFWYQGYWLSPANVPVKKHVKWMEDIHPLFKGKRVTVFAGDGGDHHNYLFHETRDDVTYYLNGSGRHGTSFMHVAWDGQQVSVHPRFIDVAVPQKKKPSGIMAEVMRVMKLKTFWGGVGFGVVGMLLLFFIILRKRRLTT